jgi:hypothetical protein
MGAWTVVGAPTGGDDAVADYDHFRQVTERHRRERDGGPGPGEGGFDFRTDTIGDSVLGPGLAAIQTDFERTKREMAALYGGKARAVHGAETKVRTG